MKLLKLTLGLILAASVSFACRSGDEMAILDKAGKQIGLVKKGPAIQILPQDGYFFIAAGNVMEGTREVYNMMALPGTLVKVSVLNASTFSPSAVVSFAIVNNGRQLVGKYSSTISRMTAIVRGTGCGGTLSPQ